MTLLFKVENVFGISGRGCAIVPAVSAGVDFGIRAKDEIQLRTPDGHVIDTHIASIELLKPQDGSACRMAIMLPRDLVPQDVPTGTEVWLLLP
jgi:translation elongation factor EF-Tu-like GTPase